MTLKRKSFGRVVSSHHNVFATVGQSIVSIDVHSKEYRNCSIYQMSVPEPLRDSTELSSFGRFRRIRPGRDSNHLYSSHLAWELCHFLLPIQEKQAIRWSAAYTV
jgi:hypothetical protein